MRFILLMLLLSLDMVMNQKVQNDRANLSYQPFSGEYKKPKGNSAKIYQSDSSNRSPFSPIYRNSSDHFHHKKMASANRVPPYAVLMEPLVQYSQPDPLFKDPDTSVNEPKITDSQNIATDKSNKIEKREQKYGDHASSKSSFFDDNEHGATHNTEFSSYGSYYEAPYHEEPEPIIEIIIKESNQTVAPTPAPYLPPPPKKKKEPVQVFYVKYKKDPSAGYGEDKIIYEAPIPAVTPPTNNESSGEETHDEEAYETKEVVTVPPAPSTTLKAIIRPDSEIYHGTGLHITFGESKGDVGSSFQHRESEEHESTPQASVSLPDRNTIPLTSRSGSESQINKRHQGPFGPAPVQNGGGGGFQADSRISYRPPVPTTFQQTPQFPAQPFKSVHANLNNQYSTLPAHLRNPNFQINNPSLNPPRHGQDRFPVQNFQFRPEPQNPVFQSAPQPYQTIKHVDPQPVRYSTTPRPVPQQVLQPSFHSPVDPFRSPQPQATHHVENGPAVTQYRPNFNSPDQQHQQQHREQVEQLNRLQQEQQRLQAQLAAERSKKPNLVKQSSDYAPEIIKSISPDELVFSNHRPEFAPRPPPQQQQPQQQQQHYREQIPQSFPSRPPDTFSRLNLVRTESPRPTTTTTNSPVTYASSTYSPASITTTKDQKEKKIKEEKIKEEKKKQNVAALPKEVPDDLREQLLSSGILSNADIQILDYDKIGDIPVENLPPEALANFQAVAGSEQVTFKTPYRPEDSLPSASERRNVLVKADRKGTNNKMEMKVVRFNPESNDGSKIADKYMKEGATRLEPVVLNDSKYNRYLPLKISGAQFPVPDVPELKGRNVASVVILAPVDYEFLERRDKEDEARLGRRSASPLLEVQGVHFVAGDVLKDLVKIPNTENYKKWLDKENRTAIEKQSVVLLVVEPTKKSKNEAKDIFMYDIATQRINKLKGELSSTFVKVAESNSQNRDLEEISDNPSAPGGDFTIKNTSEIPP